LWPNRPLYELFTAFCPNAYPPGAYPRIVNILKAQQADDATARTPVRDVEESISHFIPSVELKGSLAAKLQKLDILIAHLQQLRARLAGDGATDRARHKAKWLRWLGSGGA
jgi:hypothetical protein